uniref:HTH myb-type domain-containing protein n=1 Tax=Chromera velia CCMP2878 TaxID=1169474 RepID=A0A0G4IBM9_9ALVE|eukprot:Cvel_12882.t1-p1 / transcript=Cvel_12882.t1 / gene=Cvel_12882 / organism=Chromera_velia_CCMP2878 / gene_product=hypothetical protein / transcript_product=hypothetical protein / location=Cvel_scaffold860:28925-30985(+) / protein_length=687 / sequence_SO=supercontig / SO=protein_coding / is_pseudo=false
MVGTRTATQVRSHAQKYFRSMQKGTVMTVDHSLGADHIRKVKASLPEMLREYQTVKSHQSKRHRLSSRRARVRARESGDSSSHYTGRTPSGSVDSGDGETRRRASTRTLALQRRSFADIDMELEDDLEETGVEHPLTSGDGGDGSKGGDGMKIDSGESPLMGGEEEESAYAAMWDGGEWGEEEDTPWGIPTEGGTGGETEDDLPLSLSFRGPFFPRGYRPEAEREEKASGEPREVSIQTDFSFPANVFYKIETAAEAAAAAEGSSSSSSSSSAAGPSADSAAGAEDRKRRAPSSHSEGGHPSLVAYDALEEIEDAEDSDGNAPVRIGIRLRPPYGNGLAVTKVPSPMQSTVQPNPPSVKRLCVQVGGDWGQSGSGSSSTTGPLSVRHAAGTEISIGGGGRVTPASVGAPHLSPHPPFPFRSVPQQGSPQRQQQQGGEREGARLATPVSTRSLFPYVSLLPGSRSSSIVGDGILSESAAETETDTDTRTDTAMRGEGKGKQQQQQQKTAGVEIKEEPEKANPVTKPLIEVPIEPSAEPSAHPPTAPPSPAPTAAAGAENSKEDAIRKQIRDAFSRHKQHSASSFAAFRGTSRDPYSYSSMQGLWGFPYHSYYSSCVPPIPPHPFFQPHEMYAAAAAHQMAFYHPNAVHGGGGGSFQPDASSSGGGGGVGGNVSGDSPEAVPSGVAPTQ